MKIICIMGLLVVLSCQQKKLATLDSFEKDILQPILSLLLSSNMRNALKFE